MNRIFIATRPTRDRVEVVLSEALTGFRGEPVSISSENSLVDWICGRKLTLNVLTLIDFLGPERELLKEESFVECFRCGHSYAHALLVAISTLYLKATGKDAELNPNYVCGQADVGAKDGSLYVECGTLRPDKVIEAMYAGISLLVVPYNHGIRPIPENLKGKDVGFLFEPKDIPSRDVFKNNPTRNLSKVMNYNPFEDFENIHRECAVRYARDKFGIIIDKPIVAKKEAPKDDDWCPHNID